MNLGLKAASVILLFFSCAERRAATTIQPSREEPKGALIVAYNRRLLAIANAEDHLLTLKGARTLAMMHLAVHDALNAIVPRYASYLDLESAPDADPTAAAAQAAHDVAVQQYPNAGDELALELDTWLLPLADGPAKASGRALGRAAAAAISKARQSDAWDADGEYQLAPPGPGVYATFSAHSGTPPDFVFGSGWGRARPFLLQGPQQFPLPPPPRIDSSAYAEAFEEVKSLGRFDSAVRTADQTHAAFWWKDFVENSLNRLAADWVIGKADLWESARLFALINASIFDGYVHAFASKFFFNHWRPYTAIRQADNDGNPNTVPDPDWDNTHHHTYPFPSYPSAHATVCAAPLSILSSTFGDAQPFSMVTAQVNEGGPLSPLMDVTPPARSFESFSAAAKECALSRVYLGIHFRYDSEAGNALGTQIGQYALQHFLVPLERAR
jgi:membrane-associated phospholipid phosphatase